MLETLQNVANRNLPINNELILAAREDILTKQAITIVGPTGLGVISSCNHVLTSENSNNNAKICYDDGFGSRNGYLAGFHNLILDKLSFAENYDPQLISRHEQTLKRIFPVTESKNYKVSKDLTNSSPRKERTRFYHYEYQNKLFVGLAEFLLDAIRSTGQSLVIVIDNAGSLPRSSKDLLQTILRINDSSESLRFLLLDRSGKLSLPNITKITAPNYSVSDFKKHLSKDQNYSDYFIRQVYDLSNGNLLTGRSLLICYQSGITLNHHLSVDAIIDFYLSSIDFQTRNNMAIEYVQSGFSGDLILQRNYQLLPADITEDKNLNLHKKSLENYLNGNGPLVFIYALAIENKTIRMQALAPLFDILMGIGLYDTWFDLFSSIYLDPDLRISGDGNSDINGLFINAAFVLYSMGHVGASTPFLMEFLASFPASNFVPTALYALSMTYGRYKVPVDLETAELYAKQNLSLIDLHFSDHPRYVYIKAFAENAYAYILARKGMLNDALALCENGILAVADFYGEEQYKLHRSILVYNTSQIYEIIGEVEMAEQKLKQAIDLDPYYAEYHNDLGNLLSKNQDRALEALHEYEQAIFLSPPYYEAHLNRGMLQVKLGEFQSAERDFNRTIEIKPDEWRAFRELGNLMLNQGHLEQAYNCYQQAINLDAKYPDLYVNLGLVCSEIGRTDDAINHYQKALFINPKHVEAHNNLAAELVILKRYEQALDHAIAASQLSSDDDIQVNLRLIEELIKNLK
jgi:tetratricopeptide (TPR) repeat protein